MILGLSLADENIGSITDAVKSVGTGGATIIGGGFYLRGHRGERQRHCVLRNRTYTRRDVSDRERLTSAGTHVNRSADRTSPRNAPAAVAGYDVGERIHVVAGTRARISRRFYDAESRSTLRSGAVPIERSNSFFGERLSKSGPVAWKSLGSNWKRETTHFTVRVKLYVPFSCGESATALAAQMMPTMDADSISIR
jgi:hypothetical protein